jgi:hypothetical protein
LRDRAFLTSAALAKTILLLPLYVRKFAFQSLDRRLPVATLQVFAADFNLHALTFIEVCSSASMAAV